MGKAKKRIPPPKAKPSKETKVPIPEIPPVKNNEWPLLRFHFADNKRFLVTDWRSEEKDLLFSFFCKLEQTKWPQVIQTGGRGGRKVGLGYTPIPQSQLPAPLPDWISPDVSVFELRVSQRMRVFAFRTGDVCNIVWYDRDHAL